MLEFVTKDPRVVVQADEMSLMNAFDLTPMEARFLQAMLLGGWIGIKEFPEATASIRQLIFLMRAKLERPHGVTIINNGMRQYALPVVAKETVRKVLERVQGG